MDYLEFRNQVTEEMRDRFPDMKIESQHVSKLQGQSYDGISMTPEGTNVAATMNLEPAYEQIQAGVPMNLVMDQVEHAVSNAVSQIPAVDVITLSNYDQMKDTLVMQMVSVEESQVNLSNVPHQTIEDMAVVYRFELDQTSEGSASILVTNQMLAAYGVTAEQLHQDAMEAAQENHPATLRNMNEVLMEMTNGMIPMPEEPSPMWVASVEGGVHGAAVLQYPDFLDQAAETLGGDFFVLPSSVHEVLLLPDDGSMEISHLEEMVRSVNEAEVAPADRLSNQVFHYDSEDRIFETARNFEMREAMKEEAILSDEMPAMENETITVLLVEPGEYPKVVEVGTELEDLQEMVGGNIEVTYPFDDSVGLIMNEEGKIEGLPLNRGLIDEDGRLYDVIAGSFLVAGLTEDSFGSLTPEQIDQFEEKFHQPEAFLKMGKGIMAVPIPDDVIQSAKDAEREAPMKVKKPERDDH